MTHEIRCGAGPNRPPNQHSVIVQRRHGQYRVKHSKRLSECFLVTATIWRTLRRNILSTLSRSIWAKSLHNSCLDAPLTRTSMWAYLLGYQPPNLRVTRWLWLLCYLQQLSVLKIDLLLSWVRFCRRLWRTAATELWRKTSGSFDSDVICVIRKRPEISSSLR